MPEDRQPFADRLYGALLRLLPYEFRLEFGSDMEETFRLQRMETERDYGFHAVLRMWGATIADIVRMAPREHVSVLAQDAAYALRMMRKNPGYTSAAVMILALGIGVNTSIFSAVNAVLLQPLPYVNDGDLVVLRQHGAHMGGDIAFSPAEIDDYRRENRTLSGLVEYHSMAFTLLGGNEAHRVRTGVVSAGFFDLFGVKPLIGRTFVPDDDRPGAAPVLVLSYEYWKRKEGGDPNIVGRVFQMNDKPHVVVGVLPLIPQYPNENDVYMPTSACPYRSTPENIADRGYRMMSLFGRLKPGVTAAECRLDIGAVAHHMATAHPNFYPAEMGFAGTASGLRGDLTRRARPTLFALTGAALFVLLIACANVANLTMARMAGREQELVIRRAVGAGSGRLLRQLLTESLIMALLAAGLGVLCAAGSIKLLAQFAGQLTPRAREIAIDGWVLAFAILCASLTTVVFGSLAALSSWRDVASGVKEGSRANAERRGHFVRSLLIAAQVGFSYVLLIGAGLMVRSFVQMNRVDAGFIPQRVLSVGFARNWSKYSSKESRHAFSNQLLKRVEALPGVLNAATSNSYPLDPDMVAMARTMEHQWHFIVEGDGRGESEWPGVKALRIASPGYFRTLGIPLLSGRAFLDSDTESTPQVVMINRALGKQAWGDADPLGRRLSFDGGQDWATIVGVAADTKEFGLGAETPFEIYLPEGQFPASGVALVRTTSDPASVEALVRKAILEIDPETAITHVESLEEVRADSIASPRTTACMFSLFAVLAFLIALTGIGSMLALWVKQRTREIGIRMALGARPGRILGTVIRQGMSMVAIGLLFGYLGAVLLTRFLKVLLFQVEPTDGPTYALVSAVLLLAALVACILPARRAARIDPHVALRCE
ncbi:MAG TPA: ABC transporter permease [Bryobacteraceae bacterium]|nr:ABC transporter permease [Bryobacteraceae bacterium]